MAAESEKTLGQKLEEIGERIYRALKFVALYILPPALAATITYLYTRAYTVPMSYRPERIEVRMYVPANNVVSDPLVILDRMPWQTYNDFKLERRYKLFPDNDSSPEVFVFVKEPK